MTDWDHGWRKWLLFTIMSVVLGPFVLIAIGIVIEHFATLRP